MGNALLRQRASTAVNVTVGRRGREYLTEREVERLVEAAKQNRSGHRDATAILVAYRHGLRASEVVVLRWDDIDLATGRLHVRRAKGGDVSVHPISARESRALRKLLREASKSPYVFTARRGAGGAHGATVAAQDRGVKHHRGKPSPVKASARLRGHDADGHRAFPPVAC
jgi:integrase